MPLSKFRIGEPPLAPANDTLDWHEAHAALWSLRKAEANLERTVRGLGMREALVGQSRASRPAAAEAASDTRERLAEVNGSFGLLRASIAVLEALVALGAGTPVSSTATAFR